MNANQYVSNYALLRFLPYPETGEFVNVGVLVACLQPRLLDFAAERTMPDRAKSLFPRQNEHAFDAVLEALRQEMQRLKGQSHDPKTVQFAFNEAVRVRETTFRFGEVRTILTQNPPDFGGGTFRALRPDGGAHAERRDGCTGMNTPSGYEHRKSYGGRWNLRQPNEVIEFNLP